MTDQQLETMRARLEHGSEDMRPVARRARDDARALLAEVERLQALLQREHGARCLDSLDNGATCDVCPSLRTPAGGVSGL